jgi:hypothetical protein
MLALAVFVAAGAPNAWALLVPARRVTRGGNRILSEASFEQFKLVAADAAEDDEFGGSVAIDGDTVVVGAYRKDDETGAVYVLRASDGEELAKLTASDAAADDKFGYSVAIDGDTIVVGTYRGEAAYVFRTTDGGATYGQVAILTASDAAEDDYFGYSVAIDGATIVIGAYGAGTGGAVYILRTSDGGATYDQVAKLTAADAAANDYFGYSVAIDGATIVIGAYGDDDAGLVSGSAYVYRTSDDGATYGQVAKLTAADAAAGDYFGKSVAIAGDTVVVSAHWKSSARGAAYVFRTTDGGATYDQVAKLTAADAAWNDYFGYSVAIDGDTIVIGAYGDDDGDYNSGSAYVYRTSDDGATYGQVAKLTAADAAGGDYFGKSVAIDGNTIVVGASDDDDGGWTSGSAYVFSGTGSEGLVAGSDSAPTPQPTTAALGSDGSDLAQTPQPTIAALGSDAATRTGPLLALLVAVGLAL